jgi:hypothetical protein
MKALFGFSIMLGVLLFCESAVALVKKPPQPPKGFVSIQNPNLSEGECRNLGGEVMNHYICGSGELCQTTDQYGQKHSVCISQYYGPKK